MNKIKRFVLDILKKDTNYKSLIPYTVDYKDSKVPESFGGVCTYSLFKSKIYIKEKYINDVGLLRHEITHAKQFGRLWIIHTTLYLLSSTYRLFMELEAYREQVKAYNYKKGLDYSWIIDALYNKYNLEMSKESIQIYADYMFYDIIKR